MSEPRTLRSIALRARRRAGAFVRSARRSSAEGEYATPLPKSIRVESPRETLAACRAAMEHEVAGAYLRFGDGDVNLLRHEDELLQPASRELSAEIEEVFELGGAGILKALPLHSPRFGLYPGMRPGVHGSSDEWAERLLRRCFPYFIGTPIYSSNALSYCAIFDPAPAVETIRLLRRRTTVFVGNGDVPRSVVEQLFGDVVHVRTAARDSYREIGRVEADLQAALRRVDGFAVLPIAMGCAGRVLAKRVLRSGRNVFCFDFGSLLDHLCGWNTRAWIELVDFDADRFLAEL